MRSHAGAAGGQPGPCWKLAGQLDIAVWQVASANPRGTGWGWEGHPCQTGTSVRGHVSNSPQLTSTAPPHPTRGTTADGEGALAQAQAEGGAFLEQGPQRSPSLSHPASHPRLYLSHAVPQNCYPLCKFLGQVTSVAHSLCTHSISTPALLLGHKHIKWCKVSGAPACHRAGQPSQLLFTSLISCCDNGRY